MTDPVVFLDGLPPEQPSSGELPKDGLCGRCGKHHLLCPECGAHVETGYGFAGGELGTYYACDECDYFMKQQDQAAEKCKP